jgi:putative transposase
MSKIGNYSRYTTSFKIAVKLGIANPDHVKALPRTTRYNFKNSDSEDLVGREYEGLAERVSQVKEILDSRTATATALAMARFAQFIKKIGNKVNSLSKSKDPKLRRQFINLVKQSEDYIPRKRILDFFEISARRFKNWQFHPEGCIRAPNFESVAQYPHQLTNNEIQEIIRAYRDPEMMSWSSYAIAADLIRKHIVMAGISTIMEYARKLGLHKRSIRKKKQKRGSVAAKKVDQVWHMDVTRLISADNITHYLHLVMDNYSRKILSWHLSTKLRAYNSRRVIKSAIKSMKRNEGEPVNLITDGGSENINFTVRDFLKYTDVNLVVAQRDVHYSNSMIEAVNRTLKYRHIFPHNIPESIRLKEFVGKAVKEYNHRPHSRLKLLTPVESYDGLTYSREKFSELKDEARIKRMRHNRRACPPLSPMEKGEDNKVQIIKFPLISKKYSKILDKNGNIVSVSCVGCTKCRK